MEAEDPQAASLTLAALPDELLVRCLASLSQEDRFRHAALVCKRFRALCLTPSLLTSISVRAGADPLPRYRALLTFLAAHATAVHHLELRSYSQTNEEAVAAAVTSCLAACGAAGRLEELTVGLWTPQGSVETWLPQLTSLRRLRLGTVARPLHLPPGVSRLEALLDAELTGCPLHLGHARLPPALTKLVLRDMASTQLPHQLSQLGALESLELDGIRFAREGLGALAGLASLTELRLPMRPRLSLEGLGQLTGLQRLVVTPLEGPDFDAALGQLQHLTCLALAGQLTRFPPTLAALPRLERFWCHTVGKTEGHDVALPQGPWLLSLRWLGLRWRVLREAPPVLRDAPCLEYLSCLDAPWLREDADSDSDSSSSGSDDGSGSSSDDEAGAAPAAAAALQPGAEEPCWDEEAAEAAERWRGFWALVATHPPILCLGFDSNEHVGGELLDALVDLHAYRPGLQVRRTSRRGGLTFFEEVLRCEAIPPTSG